MTIDQVLNLIPEDLKNELPLEYLAAEQISKIEISPKEKTSVQDKIAAFEKTIKGDENERQQNKPEVEVSRNKVSSLREKFEKMSSQENSSWKDKVKESSGQGSEISK